MTRWWTGRAQFAVWCLILSATIYTVGSVMSRSNQPVILAAAPTITAGLLLPLLGLAAGLIYWRGGRQVLWPRWTWRLLGMVVAIGAAYVAAQINYENDLDKGVQFAAVLLWMAAVVAAMAVAWQRNEPRSTDEPASRREIALLIGIIVVSFLLRVIDLEHIPAMIAGDETKYAVPAIEMFNLRVMMPFTTGIDGHWNLYFMINSIFIKVLGSTMTAIRVPSVLMGVLSIVAAYAITRQLWGWRAALIAAALLATFHHHLHFSRVGFNSINDALFAMLSFACLWLGWRTGRRRAWLMAALALGFSQYFYVAGRLILVQTIVLGLYWLITRPRQVRAQALNIALAVGVFLCVFIPIIYFASIRIDDYMGSLNGKNILISGWLRHEVEATGLGEPEILWRQLQDVVTMFTRANDSAFYWTESVLTSVMVLLAVLALLYFVWHALDGPYFWLLSSLGLLILFGGVLMVSPSAGIHRMMSADPLLYIAIGVLLDRVWRGLDRIVHRPRAVAVVVAAAISLLMFFDVRHYFVDYIQGAELTSPEIQLNMVQHYLMDVHARIGQQPYQIVCVGLNADYCQGTTLRYLVPRMFEQTTILDNDQTRVDTPPIPGQPQILIVNATWPNEIEQARQHHLQVAPRRFNSPMGDLQFMAWEVPPRF